LGQDDVAGVWSVETGVGHDSGEHVLFLVKVAIGVEAQSVSKDCEANIWHPSRPSFTQRDYPNELIDLRRNGAEDIQINN
jgi:hypothetical protein